MHKFFPFRGERKQNISSVTSPESGSSPLKTICANGFCMRMDFMMDYLHTVPVSVAQSDAGPIFLSGGPATFFRED